MSNYNKKKKKSYTPFIFASVLLFIHVKRLINIMHLISVRRDLHPHWSRCRRSRLKHWSCRFRSVRSIKWNICTGHSGLFERSTAEATLVCISGQAFKLNKCWCVVFQMKYIHPVFLSCMVSSVSQLGWLRSVCSRYLQSLDRPTRNKRTNQEFVCCFYESQVWHILLKKRAKTCFNFMNWCHIILSLF